MKTLMTLCLALIFSATSFATPVDKLLEEVTTVETKGQTFKLSIKEAVGRVTVSIYDAKGKLVENNLFKVDQPVSVPFNLSQLPEGEYRVKVASNEEAVSFPIVSKKPVEERMLAYVEVLSPNTVSLRVMGIEKPGTTVSFFNARTMQKIKVDHVTELGGFSKNYVLANLTVDDVYMKVEDTAGKSKIFYF